jgi:hypothetical protein
LNPTFMNHYVGRAERQNAYQRARLQGLQIHLQQELVRGEIARVRHRQDLERRFRRLKQPLPPGNNDSVEVGQDSSLASLANSSFLNQRDVTAWRDHYDALGQIHTLINEQISRRNVTRQPPPLVPNQFDRATGSAAWPALLTTATNLRFATYRLSQLLAEWSAAGNDPTSPAAIEARQVIRTLTTDLAKMAVAGDIDETAYRISRDFLNSAANETKFAEEAATARCALPLAVRE